MLGIMPLTYGQAVPHTFNLPHCKRSGLVCSFPHAQLFINPHACGQSLLMQEVSVCMSVIKDRGGLCKFTI